MRIMDLRSNPRDSHHRVAATIVWEDCDHKPQELFYETGRDFTDVIFCNPDAFLVGALLPAIQRGEERIAIDAPVCPELHTGVMVALSWLRKWGLIQSFILIEAQPGVPYPPAILPRAGSFLSGGVDSLALLRVNRLNFPRDHPNALKDCLFVHGFDIGGFAKGSPEIASYELTLKSVTVVAQDADVTLIPVFTNVRHLLDDVSFWINKFHGAAMASVAHAFSRRLTSISIALDFDVTNVVNAANNPLIEPNFSSAGMRIRHEGLLYSRLDKVRLLSNWPVALNNLRVCTMNPPGELNCGRCEKCLRTMLQLLVCGGLEKTEVFQAHNVLPEMLEPIRITDKYQDVWYAELIAPLMAQGRLDLVEIIQRKRREFEMRLAWQEERDWKGAVKKFDRKWLGGSLYKTYGAIRERWVH